MRFFSTGFFRGLVAQVAGSIVGMAFVMAVRVLMGEPAWEREPVIVGGMIIGALASAIGAQAATALMSFIGALCLLGLYVLSPQARKIR